jgi:hypothetical protein
MEQKNRQAKSNVEELLKFPQQVERELTYWLKEKRVSCIENAIKANDINTTFAGTYSLDSMDCIHPDDDEILDLMLDEDGDLIDNISDSLEVEESFVEAG